MKPSAPAIACSLAALAAMLCAGCSFVDSSASISQSIASPFESSSSSSPEGSESAYRSDVRDYTNSYVATAKSDPNDFLRGIAPIAKKHGISNWEADRTTWVGIGEGLAKAKVSQAELEAYKDGLAGTDAGKKADIQSGYASYGKPK